MKKSTPLFLTLFLLVFHTALIAQTVNFALKTGPSVNFVFDSIDKYNNGIVIPSFLTLRVEAGTKWDLYVGTNTSTGGFFDVNTSYSSTGISSIPVNVLQARISNASHTSPKDNVFFGLTDISNPEYLIGSPATDAASNVCPSSGTNTAGSYTTEPQCYTFKVDLKAKPGLGYRPGSYSLQIDFVIVPDL